MFYSCTEHILEVADNYLGLLLTEHLTLFTYGKGSCKFSKQNSFYCKLSGGWSVVPCPRYMTQQCGRPFNKGRAFEGHKIYYALMLYIMRFYIAPNLAVNGDMAWVPPSNGSPRGT